MSSYSTGDVLRAFGMLLILAACPAPAIAAAGPALGSVEEAVSTLVADALAANLELEGASAGVGERLAALDQARARYLPTLDFSARYSAADGGRTVDFPVGDLLNPVYATLNQLTGSARFAPVANQEIEFQRTREQDTKLSLTQPLYDPRISAARAAAESQYESAAAGRAALAGRIERDMREAYYRWLQARAQIAIFAATLELATENHRVNDSLFRNGKITRDLVFRAEADQLEVEQSQLGARNSERLAQSYVNLLRNAPFDRALPETTVEDPDIDHMRAGLAGRTAQPSLSLAPLQETALRRRAELKQLDAVAAAAAAGERLARAAFKPRLAFALDAGTQGDTYGIGSDDRYVLASLVLRFNLFSGGADQAGLAGARAVEREAHASRTAEEQTIRFEVQRALQDLELAEASLGTAAKRVEAAAGAFRIAARKRDLGQINQAEFIDSRRALTDAQLSLNVTRFSALSSLAELEYALGAGARDLPPESQP
ncbi:MAG TPA: TolC family protein [Steroidobacteraceae bacterium]